MFDTNVVFLRGTVHRDPVARTLASGGTVTQFDLTTRCGGVASTVPISVADVAVECRADDEVVVAGHVHRRFFRASGATQSRTEVVAAKVVPARRRAAVRRLAGAAAELIVADE
ncbi:MAG: hypothetical protein QNJ12_20120 [Ilumatobacter sp.]|uniref:single-stranded DNA-binding protein n=1 Tax=Ilumatobacter sp. TaxID=1967498 RepID=UPI0026059713|nr:hypothetical protein [Ilumatobacter sp.]MDJ0771107.1 hypothetical protein [Ilumatobacter sp.]